MQRSTIAAKDKLSPGQHQVRVEFDYDGDGIGKGGTATLYVDGNEAASGRIERTHAFNDSLCETGGVGTDAGSPVSTDYGPGDNTFTGEINWSLETWARQPRPPARPRATDALRDDATVGRRRRSALCSAAEASALTNGWVPAHTPAGSGPRRNRRSRLLVTDLDHAYERALRAGATDSLSKSGSRDIPAHSAEG